MISDCFKMIHIGKRIWGVVPEESIDRNVKKRTNNDVKGFVSNLTKYAYITVVVVNIFRKFQYPLGRNKWGRIL